ncbi:hypothetical protein LEP1GSC061_1059 [Leptospira wolffii serovar Khorat str. Khorat-H2]|nr:hypothetical protein LEP1GSC061_1059 [Leptospira wolffii serovar Khorat str. Khorat-H2]
MERIFSSFPDPFGHIPILPWGQDGTDRKIYDSSRHSKVICYNLGSARRD